MKTFRILSILLLGYGMQGLAQSTSYAGVFEEDKSKIVFQIKSQMNYGKVEAQLSIYPSHQSQPVSVMIPVTNDSVKYIQKGKVYSFLFPTNYKQIARVQLIAVYAWQLTGKADGAPPKKITLSNKTTDTPFATISNLQKKWLINSNEVKMLKEGSKQD